ncbi:MAG: aryl-sulfate sulfotransferase [Alphaproteobacteria bacterium]|nr:aryl-sulfate sulfotransferase [Alphaproteobacteria bacterium]
MLLLPFTLLGCGGPSLRAPEIRVLDAAPTVVEVRWPADGEDEAWVDFDGGRAPAALDDEGWWRAMLLGLTQNADVTLTAATRAGDRVREGQAQGVTTGLFPAGLPTMVVSGDPGPLDGRFLLGSLAGEHAAVVILNAEGELVWARVIPEGYASPQARLALGGGAVVHNVVDVGRMDDVGALNWVGFDGEVQRALETPGAHHTFAEQAPGEVGYLAVDVRTDDQGAGVVGDALVEVDADGQTTTVFSTWDQWPVRYRPQPLFFPQGYDWTHGNALEYVPERDAWLACFGNIDTIAEMSRADGAVDFVIGAEGDYVFEPPESAIDFPHAPLWLDERRLVVFDSGEEGGRPAQVTIFDIDRDSGVANVEHLIREGLPVNALGSAVPVGDDHLLISWGSDGVAGLYTLEGDAVWDLKVQAGGFFARLEVIDDLYGAP